MGIKSGVFVALLASCTAVPLREQECYGGLLDYYAEKRKPYCIKSESPPRLFKKTLTVRAESENMEVIYTGEIGSDGYCLTPVYFKKFRIRSYCTLDSGSLDACIWQDDNSKIILQLRNENPEGCNRKPWNVLETVFERTKVDFVEGESTDPGFKEAVERINQKN